MENKNVALIACTNGYGHIRRLLILSQALKECGLTPVLFVPLLPTKIIAKKEGIVIPEIVDFDTFTKKENWLNGTAVDWLKFAPSFSDFDIVISDNLIEVLLIRPDAWLSGSFFWHESLQGFSGDLKLQALNLLRKYKPRMISSRMFTSDSVKLHTRLFEVGLYAPQSFDIKQKNKNDALVACGMGGSVKRQAKEFIKSLAKKESTKFQRIWVEPDILPHRHPSWMIPATFTHEMYQNILAAVIRPSVGTVTNSLLSGAKVFSFYECDNSEMELNALRIQSYGVGENTSTVDNAWSRAELFATDSNSQIEHLNKVQSLDIGGSQQTASIILENS